MKKIVLTVCIAALSLFVANAQNVYTSKSGKVSFFSHAPLEDIFAESEKLDAAINIKTMEVAAKVRVTDLKMENSLQEEHLHEKYLEGHKKGKEFALFNGKLTGDIDWTKDGEYTLQAEGDLMIHGIGRKRTIDVLISINDGVISSATKFKVKVADHKVEIPKLVIQKVAEEVEVTMTATYQLYTPKK